MRNKIIEILRENSRLSNAEIAIMLGVKEADVVAEIKAMEDEGIITGYSAVINWEKLSEQRVTAIIELKVSPKKGVGFDETAKEIAEFDEVENIYLMSGGFDLAVTVKGKSLQEIAKFVQTRLSTIESVDSTSTHFVLTRFKENNILMNKNDQDERGHYVL